MAVAFRLRACYRGALSLVATGCALGSNNLLAGDWHQSVSVPVTYETDSNPTFVPSNSTTLRRTRIVPDYKLTGKFSEQEFWTNLALHVERSSDKNISLPRQDPSLQLGWRQTTQTGEFGLVAKYQEASTRESELQETGVIVRDGTRKTQSLGGNWRTSMSERSSLAANVDYTTVSYDGGTQTGNRNTSLSVNYTHVWSERIEPFLRLSTTHYVPTSSTLAATNNATLTGGAQIKASDNMDWTVQASTSRISGTTSSNPWQGSIALRHMSERHTTSFELGRSVSAGASGANGFVESDRAKGSWTYTVDARTHTGVDASRMSTKSLVPNVMSQVGAWVNHELSPYWNARLSYQYTQREQPGLAAVSSGLLGLSLIYTHPDL